MRSRFSLRFVLAEGVPSQSDLDALWGSDLPVTRNPDDGVLTLGDPADPLATVDLLSADDPRGRAVIAAIRRLAERCGAPEPLETVAFILDHASAVVVAQPRIPAEDDDSIEAALEPLDALWDLLFEAHGGLLQIDDEGIYGDEGLLIATEPVA